MDKFDFVAQLSKLRTSSTFLSLIGYRNDHSEIADYNIVFNMSYENALKRSIAALTPYVPENDLETTAKAELLTSFNTSLANLKETPVEAIQDAYDHFIDGNGEYIKGVKLHRESDTLHLYGLVVNKRVIMPGNYPKKNKRPLTIAKDKLRKLCPVDRFRQFKIVPDQLDSISVQNLSFLPPEN